MVNPIQHHPFIERPTAPVFNEGAASTASKVAAFVSAAFAVFGSFIFLPAQIALSVSMGAVALMSLLYCTSNNERVVHVMEGPPQRWYQPVVDASRVFVPRNVVPVVNPGPRVPVGDRVQPHLVVNPRTVNQLYANAQPAPMYVPVNPRPVYPVPNQIANMRNVAPAVGHQQGPHVIARDAVPVANPGARIPVGHGHQPLGPTIMPLPASHNNHQPGFQVVLSQQPAQGQNPAEPRRRVPVGHSQ